ncbi:sulfotransferase [Glycomyces sp. TRM65418]|uniref:sulfotransferase family protein n=1 Tax=Glycomyces sp. TRM65418 TaxID=2867006 RepID=UPI001CE70B4C|nr:sulfotransferase [Glycomyces sp. TRM65418]MCC3764747.1 sulfotransferase [Glycomyces sp. TRM65418]QZD54402.1 sulfotransferase [Glycomyces sp. TRM65418]
MRRTARWLTAVNTISAPRVNAQRARVDQVFDKMVRRAERAAEADASIAAEFVDSYRFLLRQVAKQGTLSMVGWQGFIDDLTRRMTNHLRVENLIRENPEIAQQPIDRPIVVIGLPRTATTLTHKILIQPEGNRAPLMWELMNTHRGDIDPKLRGKLIKDAQQMASLASKASPVWDLIHPMNALQPEECVFALPHGYQFITRATMPAYRRWVDERDYTEDYGHLKRVLQVLQWRQPQKRWVLKTPFHLFNLDVLLKVFPDATIVWMHRDPATVMGSWCSLVETGRALHHRTYDASKIGPEWLDIFGKGVAKARAVRATALRERFVDVPYHSLTADPSGYLPKLFARLGMEWTAKEAANLEQVLARPGMRRSHEYHLSRYGVELDDVEKAFGDYGRLGF